MLKPLRALFALACGCCLPLVHAAELDEALKLIQRGDYLQALAAFKPMANQGNAEAQYQLGQIYERGLGIVPDDYWAQHWYRLASEQGHPAAAEALVGMATRLHASDESMAPGADPEIPSTETPAPELEALPPAEPESLPAPSAPVAAETPVPGSSPAAANVLGLPEIARPAPPAVDRYGYRLPAEETIQLQVSPGEQAALDLAAARGLRIHFDPAVPVPSPRGDDVTGLPTGDGPSPETSTPSFAAGPAAPSTPAETTSPEASTDMSPGSESASASATVPVIAGLPPEANQAALTSLDAAALKAAAEAGDPAAQRELALRHHQGRGMPRDLKQAVIWYQKAAQQGDAAAQFHLGNLYLMGEGLARDDAWAITWFRRAAVQGHPAAQSNLDNLLRLEARKP